MNDRSFLISRTRKKNQISSRFPSLLDISIASIETGCGDLEDILDDLADSHETGDDDDDDDDIECRVGLQDCPDGQKCTGKLSNPDVGYVDDSHCVDIIGNKQHGDTCTRDAAAANDDCGKGLFCFAGCTACEGEGVCETFCDNSDTSFEALSSVCADHDLEDNFCYNFNDGWFPVCWPTCDPLGDDCADHEVCSSISEMPFLCIPLVLETGLDGTDGSECFGGGTRIAGNTCAIENQLADCNSESCCTPFCDLRNSNFECPHPEEQCIPVASPLPDMGHLGLCALPPE